ncbi:MAG: sensor histidine kinase [Microscillaceae bacterium]|jgi:signal transduction histidine kinase|nr:sensor histidine kinase [Microscillaceae bacterium]
MNNLHLKRIFFIGFFIFLQFWAKGQAPLILTHDSTYIPLAKQVWVLEDATKTLDITQILNPKNQKKFSLSKQETPFHAYSLANYWFKFAVEAHKLAFNDEWFVQLHNPNIDTVEVYFLNQKNEIIQKYLTGDKFPFYQRPVTYHKFLFPIPFEKTTQIKVYIALRGIYAKNHNLDIVEKKTLLNQGQNTVSFYIFLKAIFFTLLIYNFLLYLVLRDLAYLYYVGYLLFGLTYFLAIDGLGFRVIYPHLPFLTSHVANVSAFYCAICLNWFAYHFLHLEQIRRFWVKKALWAMIILSHLLLLLMFGNVWQIGSIPVLFLGVLFVGLSMTFAFSLGLLGLRERSRQATFFIIATVFLTIGIWMNIFRRFGINIPEIIGENAYQIGMALEGILLSFALADRIKIADREKRQAQETAIAALQKNEAIIREQNTLLEQRVKERTAEIEQKNKDLRQKSNELEKVNATKDKLFGIIGHDLRSPINSLKGLMDMLANQYISAEEFVMFSGKLRNGVEHAHFTLNNLLEWANTQLKGLKAEPCATNLAELGNENFNFLEQLAAGKQLQLINQIAPDLEAYVDPDQINLVFRNLISNAIKFTPENGSITLQSQMEDTFCQIAVTDTGIGMNAENAAKLFNKTTHFSTYGTSGEKGTGLGLLLCQEMVEKNGGSIWVESELGKGTSFKFRLPLQAQESA